MHKEFPNIVKRILNDAGRAIESGAEDLTFHALESLACEVKVALDENDIERAKKICDVLIKSIAEQTKP
jgi:hypothetical protein